MLTNANTALLAILIVNTWQYAGYIYVDLFDRIANCAKGCH